MAKPLVIFTGLAESGVSTRMGALQLALRRNHGFRTRRIDKQGNSVARSAKEDEYDFLSLILRGSTAAVLPTRPAEPCCLWMEAGSHGTEVELWEMRLDEAARAVSDFVCDGLVISISIESEPNSETLSQLDALIRPLRAKYWSSSGYRRRPWVIFDLTQYERLFAQLTPELLNLYTSTKAEVARMTPYALALKPNVQKAAINSFCQSWLRENELSRLITADTQLRMFYYSRSAAHSRRVLFQVSSAWGFLVDKTGPGARHPANCRRPSETLRALPGPRFPDLTEAQLRLLAVLKFGISSGSTWHSRSDIEAIEEVADRFFAAWRPLGIVEPLPSVVWKTPAPNMFWASDIMDATQPARR